jgi:NAD(P)-dependent dehydrogenase (short-subunit alcohol dehydrogenase family)
LTRAMAVDLGARIKVNAICPAAIKTPMLSAGFEGRKKAFDALHQAHPGGRIGLPEEVAHLARYLIAEAPDFLNGSCLGLDGGIAARLHDPA